MNLGRWRGGGGRWAHRGRHFRLLVLTWFLISRKALRCGRRKMLRGILGVVKARTISGGERTLKLRNGGHNSNEALTSDLAAFVKEKQIGGCRFMRMSEADLDGYVSFNLSFSFYFHRPLSAFIARNVCPFPYGGYCQQGSTYSFMLFEFLSSIAGKLSLYSLLSSILYDYFLGITYHSSIVRAIGTR
jgi:hypothetical protein